MVGQILQYGKGYVRIQVSGDAFGRFINMCARHQIMLWNLECTGVDYEISMSIRGFKTLRPLARKCGVKVRIINKQGLPFFLYRNKKRKLLLAGVLMGIGLMFLLSIFIWDIRISGNLSLTDDVIIEYLAQEQIYHGMRKSTVDCKELAAELRKQFDNLIWVSARIEGTCLLIEVQENTDLTLEEETDYDPSDLVANGSGTVVSIVTRTGVPQVKAGDEIKEGDLLVSGCLEIMDDNGEVAEYQYCTADADIYVKTSYTYKKVFSMEHQVKTYTGESKNGFFLRLGDKKLTFARKNVSYEEYDVLTGEEQLKLGSTFYLPVYWGKIQIQEYKTETVTYTKTEAQEVAKQELEDFLGKIQEKGVQIFENNVTIETDSQNCTASGTIIVIEKIGKRVERTTLE